MDSTTLVSITAIRAFITRSFHFPTRYNLELSTNLSFLNTEHRYLLSRHFRSLYFLNNIEHFSTTVSKEVSK